MAKYVKTDYVPEYLEPYITIGVEYPVMEECYDGKAARITNDKGDTILIVYKCCAHLDDKPWIVINR